jgi:benzodiazapine receptor
MPVSKQIHGLAGWLLLRFAAAGIGAIASANAGDFYQQLNLPA